METYSFGEWLKQQRERLRLTQRELAAMTYCSVPMIKKIEADERHPSPELAELLAAALKIPGAQHEQFIEVARGERPVDYLWQTQDKAPATPSVQATFSLPKPATPFVGREDDLAEIANLLATPACHMVTLVGPGGIGKTRLAIEMARLLADTTAFPNGVYFIPLQPLTASEFIVPTLAESLNLTFYGAGDPKTQVLAYLREKQLLLVLDNFEHLLDGIDLLPEILEHAPAVKLLVTSREQLHLQEEWVCKVGGLAFPDDSHTTTSSRYSAVQLFMQHARRVGYTLTDADTPSIIQICRLVEGMPLGIELAAAWTRALSCEAIADEISRNLDILETPARNVPSRHRTMRAVFEPTWARLSEGEQSAFMKLSVFHGGFSRESAGYVAGAPLRILSALVDKSLLRVMANDRYDIHELLRQYAREKLNERGEAKVALDRHRDYFLEFAERAEQELLGANQLDWLDHVDTELGNLRVAISWSLESGDIAAGLRLTGSLYWFWSQHGYHREGYERLVDILSLSQARDRTTERVKALIAAGYIQWFEGNYGVARPLLEEASAIAREMGSLYELVTAVRTLGHVLYSLGEYEAAGLSLEEGLLVARRLQDHYNIAWLLVALGNLTLLRGDAEKAQRLYQEGIDLLRELQDKAVLAYAVRHLGLVMRGNQDYERSKALYQESLELNFATRDRRAVAASLIGLAGLAVAQGDALYAAQLLGTARRLLNDIAAHLLFLDQLEYERQTELVRTQLDPHTFESAWAEGQAMTMEQAVARALETE